MILSSGIIRNIPKGPANGENRYEFKKRILLRYKEIYGDLLVPRRFIVPWTQDWPEDTWGILLGKNEFIVL